MSQLIQNACRFSTAVLLSEREENVKADIFHAYISLLRQTKASTSVVDADFMDDGESPLTTLQQQVR